jgi:hypothetical protein
VSITVDVDLRDHLNAPRDQGQRPTCLVFAISAAHEFSRGASDYLSPEHLHYVSAQRVHKDPNQGLSRNVVREALINDGQSFEVDWPYQASVAAIAAWTPPAALQTIHKATIDFASRTIDQVRGLLRAGAPVTLHLMMSEAMYTPDAHGVIRARRGDRPTTRHALLAVGSGHDEDGEYLLVRNSWGSTWGLAGHGWLHDPYLAPRLEMTGTIT